MDEATKQAIGAFVQKMLAAAENGANWTAEQAPLVVQEWLLWQMVEAGIWALAGLISGCVAVWLTYWMVPKWDKWDRTCNPMAFMAPAGVAICGIFAIVGITAISSLLKLWLAPRVVILEKFADLVK